MIGTVRTVLFCCWLAMVPLAVFTAKAQQVNLAKGKPITAEPYIADNLPAYLVDGDDATLFYAYPTAPLNHMVVDLGATYKLDRVLLRGFRGTDTLRIFVENDKGIRQHAFTGLLPAGKLITFPPMEGRKLILEYRPKNNTAMGELEVYAYEPQPVMVNQSGYDYRAVKRFTAPLAEDGTSFIVVKAGTNTPLFSGTVRKHVGDFSAFDPVGTAEYQIIVKGGSEGRSFPFYIAPYLIERASYKPAIQFMIDDRCWYGNTDNYKPTDENAGCPFLGVAWRDSHQFSFELPALINLYFSNPDAFSAERMPLEGRYSGMSLKLPAETPEIVRLIYYAVDIYLRGKVNHTLLKEQLAYFLYAYPYLSNYIPQEVYEKVRDYLFPIWGNAQKNRWQWHDIDHSADLFQTYTIMGTGKGQFPPGHSVIPNLMMFEVAKREGRTDAKKYWDAAFKQTEWIINQVDWNDPATTKGQRMNEYVTMQALGYFEMNYPKQAPAGLKDKILKWAEVAVSRSDNMWDFRKYKADKWVIPDIKAESDPAFDPKGSFNEPGNIAGFPVAALTAKWLLDGDTMQNRLDELAVGQIDNVFGRNPAGRHYSYDACTDFLGADLGWFQELEGGAGMLQTVRGVLDGSPKEGMYPYDPYSGDPGHTEGWVTFNTAWIEGIAYRNYDLTNLTVSDANFEKPLSSAAKDSKIGIRLLAPLNLDPGVREKARAVVSVNGRQLTTVLLEESGLDGLDFTTAVDLKQLPVRLKKADKLTISYGLGQFTRSVTVKII